MHAAAWCSCSPTKLRACHHTRMHPPHTPWPWLPPSLRAPWPPTRARAPPAQGPRGTGGRPLTLGCEDGLHRNAGRPRGRLRLARTKAQDAQDAPPHQLLALSLRQPCPACRVQHLLVQLDTLLALEPELLALSHGCRRPGLGGVAVLQQLLRAHKRTRVALSARACMHSSKSRASNDACACKRCAFAPTKARTCKHLVHSRTRTCSSACAPCQAAGHGSGGPPPPSASPLPAAPPASCGSCMHAHRGMRSGVRWVHRRMSCTIPPARSRPEHPKPVAAASHVSCFSKLASWNGFWTSRGLLGSECVLAKPSTGRCSYTCLGTCGRAQHQSHSRASTRQLCVSSRLGTLASHARADSADGVCCGAARTPRGA